MCNIIDHYIYDTNIMYNQHVQKVINELSNHQQGQTTELLTNVCVVIPSNLGSKY